jgi:hypothetical protein
VIASRVIGKADLERAAQVNDAIALEHNLTYGGAELIGKQLGVDVMGAAELGAAHAVRRHKTRPTRADAREATTHAFTMGVLIGLRAVEVVSK